MLHEKQLLAINLLVEGKQKRTDIAKACGVSRNALYDWMDNVEFKAEWEKSLQRIINYGEQSIKANLDKHIQNILVLANSAESEKIKLDANCYLIDRVLGKTTTKIDVTAEQKQTTELDSNQIESEFEDFKKNRIVVNDNDTSDDKSE